MKKLFTLLLVVSVFGASAQTTLLDYWNFNLSDTSAWHTPTSSVVPGARLDYYGAYVDYVSDAPDTTNSRDESGPTPGMSLRLRSPYGPFFITLPTTGYKNLVIKYGLWRSGSGSGIETVTYTTDGTTWDSAGLQITDGIIATTTGLGTFTVNAAAVPLDLIVLDFSGIPAANNNPKFQVQINFNTTAAGNNRIDNLSLEGIPTGLPLLLQSFTGTIVKNNAQFVWTASNEVNVKEYELQSSTDKETFATVGTVAAKNIKGLNNYEFTTTVPNKSTYYRLKMIDNNGSFHYSPIVVLNGSISDKGLSIFPNPAITNTITLTHTEALAGAIAKIITIDGKVISVSNIQTGATQTSIDVSNLIKGSYIVSYENNGGRTVTQFVK